VLVAQIKFTELASGRSVAHVGFGASSAAIKRASYASAYEARQCLLHQKAIKVHALCSH
jgi:hypothetical protein